MRTDTIDDFLTRLAARVPAPGGGATAALHAAQAAALVAMVARYSDSAKLADHAEEITTITATADRLRENALALARLPPVQRQWIDPRRAAGRCQRQRQRRISRAVRLWPGGEPAVWFVPRVQCR